VVERAGRITGYATVLAFFGHAMAETNLDMQSLIASAESFGGSGILLPSRNTALLRWCLANGLHVVQPMTLMSMDFIMSRPGHGFLRSCFDPKLDGMIACTARLDPTPRSIPEDRLSSHNLARVVASPSEGKRGGRKLRKLFVRVEDGL